MDFPICRASITLILSARDNPRRVLGAVGGFCVGAAIASRGSGNNLRHVTATVTLSLASPPFTRNAHTPVY